MDYNSMYSVYQAPSENELEDQTSRDVIANNTFAQTFAIQYEMPLNIDRLEDRVGFVLDSRFSNIEMCKQLKDILSDVDKLLYHVFKEEHGFRLHEIQKRVMNNIAYYEEQLAKPGKKVISVKHKKDKKKSIAHKKNKKGKKLWLQTK